MTLRRDVIAGEQTNLFLQPIEASQRQILAARWLNLTRVVLPAQAAEQDWPIALDHCFMRVCLDVSLGCAWHLRVKRPAIQNLSLVQLHAAIAVAEGIRNRPDTLPALNQQSLQLRRAKPCV